MTIILFSQQMTSFVSLLMFMAWTVTWATKIPSEVFIGGMFRCFNVTYNTTTGTYAIIHDKLSSLQLQAFIMAVDQINNKTDGFFDNILPDTTLKFSLDYNQNEIIGNSENLFFDATVATYYLNYSVQTTDHSLFGVVIALPYDSTVGAIQTLNGWEIPTIIAESTNTEFSHIANYPYNFRMNPSDSFAASMIYKLLRTYGWNKIAMLYTTDDIGLDYLSTFQNEAKTDPSLEYLTTQSFPPNKKTLTTYIRAVQATGATIIVLLMDDVICGRFMYQAYKNGLLVDGTQVIGTCFSTSLSAVFTAGAKSSNIDAIMKGYLNVRPDPTLYYQNKHGSQFLDFFIQLPPTRIVNSDGSVTCNSRKDDAGNSIYYYQSSIPSLSTCLGIDSFDYNRNGSNLNPTVLYSYASVLTFASALDHMIKVNSVWDTVTLASVMLNSSSNIYYDNIVGNVTFSTGIANDNSFGQGDRFSGHIYTVQNYYSSSSSSYTITSGLNEFVMVGTIDDDGVKFCSSMEYDVPCYPIVYRNFDEVSAPSDTQTTLYDYMSSSVKDIFIFFGTVMVVLGVIQISYYIMHRNTKTLKNSQLYMILITSVAILFGGIRVLAASADYTVGSCSSKLWMEHIAFRLFFGTIMLKLWRIHRIVNVTGFERVRITEFDLLKYVLLHLTLLCLGLSIVSILNDVKVGYYETISANQSTLQPVCRVGKTTLGGIVIFIIYLSEGFYMLLGLWYLYLTRAVPPIVNETKIMGPILLGSIGIISILLALIFALNFNGVQTDVTVTAGFIVIMIPSSIAYLLQKYYLIQEELRKKNKSNDTTILAEMNLFDKLKSFIQLYDITSRISPESNDNNSNNNTQYEENAEFKSALDQVIKKKTYIDRAKFVQHNIDLWKAMMVRVADEDFSTLNGTINHSLGRASSLNIPLNNNNNSNTSSVVDMNTFKIRPSSKPNPSSFSVRNQGSQQLTGIVGEEGGLGGEGGEVAMNSNTCSNEDRKNSEV